MDLRELPVSQFIRHPWEKARLRFFRHVLAKNIKEANKALRILDVGSGDGFFSQGIFPLMPDGTQLVCWDMAYDQGFLENHHHPDISYTRERPSGKYDLLLLMDVIEHVEDDQQFLRGLTQQSLTSNAHVLVSVPAWMSLFTMHDTRLGHYRRYTPSQCLKVIESAGLEVISSGGLFHSLLMPRSLQKLKERLTTSSTDPKVKDLGDWNHGKVFTALVDTVLSIDNTLSHLFARLGIQVPGLSFWAVCRNQSDR